MYTKITVRVCPAILFRSVPAEVHRAQLSSKRARINSSLPSDTLYETPNASARPLGPTEPHAWLTPHSVHSRTPQTPTCRVYIEQFCSPQESSSQPAGTSKDVQRQVSVTVKHPRTIQYIFRLQRRLRRLTERLRSDIKSQLLLLRQIARYCQPVSSRPPQDPSLTCSVNSRPSKCTRRPESKRGPTAWTLFINCFPLAPSSVTMCHIIIKPASQAFNPTPIPPPHAPARSRTMYFGFSRYRYCHTTQYSLVMVRCVQPQIP